MWRRGIIFILPLLFFAAVGGYAVWIGIIGGQEVPFTTVDQGDYIPQPAAQANKAQMYVLAGDNDQTALIAELHLSFDAIAAKLDQLDYQNNIAIIVTYGDAQNGRSITVQRVVQRNDRIMLQARFIKDFSNGGPTISTNPYHLIAIPKSGLQGRVIHFKLTNGFYVVAERTQFVP